MIVPVMWINFLKVYTTISALSLLQNNVSECEQNARDYETPSIENTIW